MQPQEEWQKKKDFVQSGPTVMFPVWVAKFWLSVFLQKVTNFYFHIKDLHCILKWGKKETNPCVQSKFRSFGVLPTSLLLQKSIPCFFHLPKFTLFRQVPLVIRIQDCQTVVFSYQFPPNEFQLPVFVFSQVWQNDGSGIRENWHVESMWERLQHIPLPHIIGYEG